MPLPNLRFREAVHYSVVFNNMRPSKPAELADGIWDMLEKCWNKEPGQRPQIGEIVELLEKFEVCYIYC